ncbi:MULTISPECIES: MBL fold metallo-hydrolase [Persephonella]|uniref:Metallo-beta-lactamase family protein n=1 Tax=Persephonella marina (strain DSM 14350 / EX-H1) TaxID=123214 RepID=C0QQ05_PERMH|nr:MULTISPECIES: MBL fold metallo-hydrolase [Persephonella]ACO03772.1 metallo-beta-lactamase family protein [Persephonella marina EX-H1]
MLKNSITFLGTGGGRVVVFRQIRYSGGLWVNIEGINILIDPGPGSLIRIFEFGFDPRDIDIIAVSHRHLDHCSDINAVIESATDSKKRPLKLLVAPDDVTGGDDPVLLKYIKDGIERIEHTEEGKEIEFGNLKIKAPVKHIHEGAKTFGLQFSTGNKTFVYVPCGKFYDKMLTGYPENADLMVFNTTFPRPVDGYSHLSIVDVEKMIKRLKPKKAVLTHFSIPMLKADPIKLAKKINKTTDIPVVAAKDGMRIQF